MSGATRALLRDGHATGFGHVDVLPRGGMLVDGLKDTPGPACSGSPDAPSTPTARFRVSSLHTLTGETARIGGPTKFAIRKLR